MPPSLLPLWVDTHTLFWKNRGIELPVLKDGGTGQALGAAQSAVRLYQSAT